MKQFNPTHFIEQYRMCGETHLSAAILPMHFLNEALLDTKKCMGVTIAIFKIQFKQS